MSEHTHHQLFVGLRAASAANYLTIAAVATRTFAVSLSRRGATSDIIWEGSRQRGSSRMSAPRSKAGKDIRMEKAGEP